MIDAQVDERGFVSATRGSLRAEVRESRESSSTAPRYFVACFGADDPLFARWVWPTEPKTGLLKPVDYLPTAADVTAFLLECAAKAEP